jgi:phosphatidylglycerol:prolipoprotein diacylglycerol transferase
VGGEGTPGERDVRIADGVIRGAPCQDTHNGRVPVLVLTFPSFDPIAFSIGPLAVHWYGLMYALAFVVGYRLLLARLRHPPFAAVTEPRAWSAADIADLLVYLIAGVLLGGRLGYCLFYQPVFYATHPLEILRVWDGGMSFHGGALGVALGVWLFARRHGRPFLQVSDLLVPVVPVGLGFGRIGNFINGELWGRPADPALPWAMVFPNVDAVPRHPSQLYEFALEGVALFVLLWLYARRGPDRGKTSAAFLLGYGVFRFAVEFTREPDSFLGLLGLGMSMGQWLCLPMIIGGGALWRWADARAHRETADAEASAGRIPH